MLDIKWIVENKGALETALKNRNSSIDLEPILQAHHTKKKLQAEFEQLRSEQNNQSKEI